MLNHWVLHTPLAAISQEPGLSSYSSINSIHWVSMHRYPHRTSRSSSYSLWAVHCPSRGSEAEVFTDHIPFLSPNWRRQHSSIS